MELVYTEFSISLCNIVFIFFSIKTFRPPNAFTLDFKRSKQRASLPL